MGPKYNPVYEEDKIKTIRLLYPDYISGGLDTYYFGAKLLQHILPQNENRPLIEVDILPPDGEEKPVTNGMMGEDEVFYIGLQSLHDYQEKF